MKPFVSGWGMHSKRAAFTLMEVMVSVIIISIVIMALLQMHGNSTNLFTNIKEKLYIGFLSSFFIANPDYGYEKKTVLADELLKDFDIDDDLRKRLKSMRLDIDYRQLETIDLSKIDDNETNSSNGLLFYTGKTIIKTNDSSVSFFRITTRSAK
ncbi:prepilin-type N-terminal cleavage/methylation domain-containing protein [bacterium]|nr:prepilin-type N-terminal cleavage/methylation domain-containing protein [bacterium]MBU1884848.1 prepilin-type N-terminal cleavage/methylation domain-containing protein [bacterium]